jgi:hypothetical protein
VRKSRRQQHREDKISSTKEDESKTKINPTIITTTTATMSTSSYQNKKLKSDSIMIKNDKKSNESSSIAGSTSSTSSLCRELKEASSYKSENSDTNSSLNYTANNSKNRKHKQKDYLITKKDESTQKKNKYSSSSFGSRSSSSSSSSTNSSSQSNSSSDSSDNETDNKGLLNDPHFNHYPLSSSPETLSNTSIQYSQHINNSTKNLKQNNNKNKLKKKHKNEIKKITSKSNDRKKRSNTVGSVPNSNHDPFRTAPFRVQPNPIVADMTAQAIANMGISSPTLLNSSNVTTSASSVSPPSLVASFIGQNQLTGNCCVTQPPITHPSLLVLARSSEKINTDNTNTNQTTVLPSQGIIKTGLSAFQPYKRPPDPFTSAPFEQQPLAINTQPDGLSQNQTINVSPSNKVNKTVRPARNKSKSATNKTTVIQTVNEPISEIGDNPSKSNPFNPFMSAPFLKTKKSSPSATKSGFSKKNFNPPPPIQFTTSISNGSLSAASVSSSNTIINAASSTDSQRSSEATNYSTHPNQSIVSSQSLNEIKSKTLTDQKNTDVVINTGMASRLIQQFNDQRSFKPKEEPPIQQQKSNIFKPSPTNTYNDTNTPASNTNRLKVDKNKTSSSKLSPPINDNTNLAKNIGESGDSVTSGTKDRQHRNHSKTKHNQSKARTSKSVVNNKKSSKLELTSSGTTGGISNMSFDDY